MNCPTVDKPRQATTRKAQKPYFLRRSSKPINPKNLTHGQAQFFPTHLNSWLIYRAEKVGLIQSLDDVLIWIFRTLQTSLNSHDASSQHFKDTKPQNKGWLWLVLHHTETRATLSQETLGPASSLGDSARSSSTLALFCWRSFS